MSAPNDPKMTFKTKRSKVPYICYNTPSPSFHSVSLYDIGISKIFAIFAFSKIFAIFATMLNLNFVFKLNLNFQSSYISNFCEGYHREHSETFS